MEYGLHTLHQSFVYFQRKFLLGENFGTAPQENTYSALGIIQLMTFSIEVCVCVCVCEATRRRLMRVMVTTCEKEFMLESLSE